MNFRAVIVALALCFVVGVFGDIASGASLSISYASELPIGPIVTPATAFTSTSAVGSTTTTTFAAVLSECGVVYPTFPVMPWMHGAENTCQVTTVTTVSTQVDLTTATATITEAASTVTKTLSLQTTGFSTITAMCALNNGLAAPCTTAVLSPTHTSAGGINLNPFYWIARAIESFHEWLSKLFKGSEVTIPKVGNPV